MPNIKFGDIDFSGDGAYVWGAGQYSAPTRSVDFIEVPGRSGGLLIDNGNYTNTKAYFDVIITKDVETNTDRLKYLLYSQKGYQKLYDSDMKGFYRMASFNSGFDIPSTEGGVVRLEFDCKPFKYDVVGDSEVVVNKTNEYVTINNEYFEESRPKITITGINEETVADGFILINGKDLRISRENANYNPTVDTEMQYVYYESAQGIVNANYMVESADFSFKPGENKVLLGGCISEIVIEPRWRTI